MNIVDVSWAELDSEPDCRGIEQFCIKVLAREGIDNWELSVMLSNNHFIQELNRKYREKDEPTDVLSFQQNGESRDDGLITAGDLIISLEYVKNEAELKRCLVHGILHLEGMEHKKSDEYFKMMERQEGILENLNDELADFHLTGDKKI